MHSLEPRENTIQSYEQACSLWSKVRYREKGKPVGRLIRMYKRADDAFLFTAKAHRENDLCFLSPNNTMTFVMPYDQWLAYGKSLEQSLHYHLPIATACSKFGVARIACSAVVSAEMGRRYNGALNVYSRYSHYWPVMNDQNLYFEGIKFDIITGKCLNPPRNKDIIEKPAERRVWRRSLAAFKKGIKIRVRIHAFDGIIEKVWREHGRGKSNTRKADWEQPDWGSQKWIELLEHCIRNREYPPELLEGLVRTRSTKEFISRKPTGEDILNNLEYICTRLSYSLRKRFGVFEEN